jgi:hypothetical protein
MSGVQSEVNSYLSAERIDALDVALAKVALRISMWIPSFPCIV